MRKLLTVLGVYAALAFSIFGPLSLTGAAAAGPAAPTADQATTDVAGPASLSIASAVDGPTIEAQPHIMGAAGNPQWAPETLALTYHSGPVIGNFSHKVYLIFWGTTWSSTYKALITRYFQDVSHDSQTNASSNVYYAVNQYYRTDTGTTLNARYRQSIGGSYSDTSLPASGCHDTHGGTQRCYTDAQVRAEVAHAIQIKGWPLNRLDAIYFVFLGNNISSCINSSCAYGSTFGPGGYCAYHSAKYSGSSSFLYANMPYAGHMLNGCGTHNYPNNDSAADSELSVTSHEHNETISDPLGSVAGHGGWYDAQGEENGDKCAWTFGTELGGTTGHKYNQVINGHHYQLQQEWSNHNLHCVTHGF